MLVAELERQQEKCKEYMLVVTDCLAVESLLGAFCLQLLIQPLSLRMFDLIFFTKGCRFNDTGASPERIEPFRIYYNRDLRGLP